MRTALIAVLVLTAGSAVAANDDLTTEEVARSEGFSCGGEFVTMGHTSSSFPMGRVITIRRTEVLEVWMWNGIGASRVWIKQIEINAGKEEMRIMAISPATSTMLRKCLEGG